MQLPTLPYDKCLHLIYGAVIAAVPAFFGYAKWGCLAGIIAAVGKEIYDAKFGGDPDIMDAVATSIGALFVYSLVLFGA